MAQDEKPSKHYVLGGSISFINQKNINSIPGTSIIPGIGGINSNNINDTDNTTLSFAPYFGIEVNPQLILGLQFEYRIANFKADDFLVDQTNQVDF